MDDVGEDQGGEAVAEGGPVHNSAFRFAFTGLRSAILRSSDARPLTYASKSRISEYVQVAFMLSIRSIGTPWIAQN